MAIKPGIILLIELLVLSEVLSQNILPDTTYPVHYNVWLNFTHSTKLKFNGIVTIDVGIKTETNQILLNDMGIFIDEVTLSKKCCDDLFPVIISHDTETIIIQLESGEQSLEVGQFYQIRVNYSGYYMPLAGQDNSRSIDPGDFVIANHVFPFSIQYVLPCYDEPQHKATFAITIQHELGTTAVSNMAAIRVEQDDQCITTTFAESPPLSTYSVAFAISNYARLQITGYKTINAFYGNLYQPSDLVFVLNINQNVLAMLEMYLNVPLDIDEINLIPIHDLAVRNFGTLGILINRHSYYYYNPHKKSTTLDQAHILRYVSRFYANKYFGSIISPERWTHIWVNQGISTLLEYSLSSQICPELQQMDLFLYKIFTQANTSVEIQPNIESRLDVLKYLDETHESWRPTALIYMIRNILTEQVFKLGLSELIIEYAYQPTNPKHLLDTLTKVGRENGVLNADQNLYTIFEEWIINRDSPNLFVVRDHKTGKIMITQLSENQSSSVWIVPYNYMTQANTTNWCVTTPDGWLQNISSLELDLSAELKSTDWIIFNREFSAFYKTNYDTTNWLLIAKQLRRGHDKIPRHTRGQLMHDAYHFWKTGNVSYTTILYLFSYLCRETNPVPFQPFLLFVGEQLPVFYGTEMYENFTKFVMNQFIPVYGRVRITDTLAKPKLSIFDEMNQATVLKYACTMNYQPCLEDAQNLLNEYLKTNTIEVGKEALPYGFVLSNENQFWQVFSRINNVDDNDKNLVKMIGFTQNSVNIEHLLNILLTKNYEVYNGLTINLEVDDRITIFEALQLNNIKASDLVYDIVEQKSGIITEIMGDESYWIISNLILYVSTAQKYEQILRIIQLYSFNRQDFEFYVDRAKSNLRTNTNLIEQAQDALTYLLENEVEQEDKRENDGHNKGESEDGSGCGLTVFSKIVIIFLNLVVIALY